MDSNGLYLKPEVIDDSLDDPDMPTRRDKQYFPDTYLDSPIMITTRLKWLVALQSDPIERPKNQFERTVNEVRATDVDWTQYDILDPEQYSQFYRYAWPSTLGSDFGDAWTVANNLYGSVRTTLEAKLGVQIPVLPRDIPAEAQIWLNRWSYFDSLVEEFSRVSALTGPNVIVMSLGNHTRAITTKDVWLLDCAPIGRFFLTYDQVLMVKDLMLSRAQCYIAAAVLYTGQPHMVRAINDICAWHESCITRYGNPGFEILKQTEALSKAYLSEMTDTIFGTDGPYGRMLDKVRAKESSLGCTSNYLTDKYDQILRSHNSIQVVTELFGMLKISGHPLVDPLVGGKSAAGEARAVDETLYDDAIRLDWEFKRTMLISYIRRHGRWPPLDFHRAGRKTRLWKLYRKQFRGLNRNSYPLADWTHVRFQKIVEFDYSPNYLDLMDDKAISFYRTNVAATWDDDVPEKSHRRLLMELINRGEFSIPDIVKLIVRREVPLDWLIVSLHPKEREFKLAPRMFSMLVLEIRVFFALTEANLADRIFPYLPQQTMTKTRLAIAKQFLEMTKPVTDSESLRMFVEVDLSRWNLRWRGMAVNPVGRTLNDMFGVVGIFDFCHEFFSQAMILVRVADCRPPGIELPHPPESDLLWYNHMGGFEGICQKLWTICTYSMIALALHKMPLSYILIGQADNQVISVVTRRHPLKTDTEVLKALRDRITQRIAEVCASVNQEVKVEECLESTSVITYSKDVYVAGVYRPTALKFHSRLFPHSSQIFPSVRTNLGAIFSTAVAGAEKSTSPISSYFLACLYAALYMLRCSGGRGPYGRQISMIKQQTKERFLEFVTFCISLPSEAGGFPVLPFIGFIYKGGSDPLGKSLASMNALGMHGGSRLHNRMLAQLSDDRWYNPKPDLTSLFMDPFSAPFLKPPTSIDGIAVTTIEALAPHVRISDIRELMSADTSSYLKSLVDILSTCRPLNPLIVRDILDCSIAGVTDTISRMFVATRTLQNVVRETGVPVVGKVLYLESQGIDYMYLRYKNLPNNPAPVVSTYELTKNLRDRWYPADVNPIVGLTTYQPFEFNVEWGNTGLAKEGMNAVMVTQYNPFETRGPYDPYVGSKTREKRSEHGYKIVGTETTSQAMRKLQLISSQLGADRNLKLLIDAVAWTRTNTQMSLISDQLPGTTGGDHCHRYAARSGHQEAYNIGSPNFATHCVVSSDNTGYLSGGIYDYPIMFQESLLVLLWTLMIGYTNNPTSFLAVTLVTQDTSLEPLPSTQVHVGDFKDHRILRYPHNPLAFVPSLRLDRVAGAIQHPALPVTDIFLPSATLRRHCLEAYFRDILRKNSNGRQIADGANVLFQSDTLDVAEVVSNKLHTIAMSICNVIVDEAVSNYMMTALLSHVRWKVDTYAYKLIPGLVMTVSPLFGHPLIMSDPLVRYLGLYDAPTYAGGYASPHHRYCGYIASLVYTALSGADRMYPHRSIGLFSSDNEHIVSETLMTCLLTDCYMWAKQGDLSVAQVNSIIGGRMLPTVRAQHREEDKVETLYKTVLTMANKLSEAAPSVSKILLGYHSGRVKGYKTSVKEILRATRQVDEWGVPTIPPSIRGSNKRIILPRTAPRSRGSVIRVCESITGTRTLGSTDVTEMDILRTLYHRNRGLGQSGVGAALSIWKPFASFFKKKPVIVIGSGYGAVARVALDVGCPYVYGIDKQDTIPMKAHRFRFYKPPLVMMSPYADQYLQMPESYTTSGDWTDPKIVDKVMQYDQGDCSVVIDIQSGQHRFGLELLKHIIKVKLAGEIWLRLYMTLAESYDIEADLTASKILYSWYDIDGQGIVHQHIIRITGWTDSLLIATRYQSETNCYPVILPRSKDRISRIDKALTLADAIYNVIYVAPGQTIQDVNSMLDHIISQSKGDYDSRFSYNQWTLYLRSKLLISWCLSPEDRTELLSYWHSQGGTQVTVGEESFWVKVDWSVCYHIATHGARLLE